MIAGFGCVVGRNGQEEGMEWWIEEVRTSGGWVREDGCKDVEIGRRCMDEGWGESASRGGCGECRVDGCDGRLGNGGGTEWRETRTKGSAGSGKAK